MIKLELPIRTWSEPNLRAHWAQRARRVRRQRSAAKMLVRAAIASLPPWNPVRDGRRYRSVALLG